MSTPKKKPSVTEPKGTVAFRLSPSLMQELIRRAEDEKLSPDKLAARYVTEALSGIWQQAMTDELEKLRRDMKRIRENQAKATATLLVLAGKLTDPVEAKKWAEKNLL